MTHAAASCKLGLGSDWPTRLARKWYVSLTHNNYILPDGATERRPGLGARERARPSGYNKRQQKALFARPRGHCSGKSFQSSAQPYHGSRDVGLLCSSRAANPIVIESRKAALIEMGLR